MLSPFTYTSEIMFIDAAHKWIPTEQFAASDGVYEPQSGVIGDPTEANAAAGTFLPGSRPAHLRCML